MTEAERSGVPLLRGIPAPQCSLPLSRHSDERSESLSACWRKESFMPSVQNPTRFLPCEMPNLRRVCSSSRRDFPKESPAESVVTCVTRWRNDTLVCHFLAYYCHYAPQSLILSGSEESCQPMALF